MFGETIDLDLDQSSREVRLIQEEEKAVEFLSSMRGKLIINRALYIAMQAMEAVEDAHKEISDIADMEYLRNTLFGGDMFTAIFEHNAELLEEARAEKIRCKARDLQTEINKAWGMDE
jgi:hypothetical protein